MDNNMLHSDNLDIDREIFHVVHVDVEISDFGLRTLML